MNTVTIQRSTTTMPPLHLTNPNLQSPRTCTSKTHRQTPQKQQRAFKITDFFCRKITKQENSQVDDQRRNVWKGRRTWSDLNVVKRYNGVTVVYSPLLSRASCRMNNAASFGYWWMKTASSTILYWRKRDIVSIEMFHTRKDMLQVVNCQTGISQKAPTYNVNVVFIEEARLDSKHTSVACLLRFLLKTRFAQLDEF